MLVAKGGTRVSAQAEYDAIIERIEEGASDRNLSANDLADLAAREAGLGARDLSAIMRFLTGTTLLNYIKERKLMAAYRYLTSGEEKPLIAVAVEIAGFDNQSSFTKRFSEVFGLPPAMATKQKDESLLQKPKTWQSLGSKNENVGQSEDVPEDSYENLYQRCENRFGMKQEEYDRVAEAMELESLYGLEPIYSNIAFELAGLEDGISMKDAFRLLEDIQKEVNESNEYNIKEGEPPMTQEEIREEAMGYAFDPFYQFMFLECDLSVGTTEFIMEMYIMPDKADLMEMDPKMIHAFAKAVDEYEFNFFFFKSAYEYYMDCGGEAYSDEDYWEYLDLLDQHYSIEEAFDNIYPGSNDFPSVEEINRDMAIIATELMCDPDMFDDPFAREVAEEEMWRGQYIDFE